MQLRRLPVGREQYQVLSGARDGARVGARDGAAGAGAQRAPSYKVYEHDPQGLGQVRPALPIKIVVSTTELQGLTCDCSAPATLISTHRRT